MNTIPRRQVFHAIWKPLALLGTGIAVGFGLGTRPPTIFPVEIPIQYSLRGREIPSAYTLLKSTPLMDELDMNGTNPGYIANTTETYAISKRGGLASFAALYGVDKDVRLILNGVFFRNPDKFEAFIEHQRAKDRRIAAFRKADLNGEWLLFVACDPNHAYSDDDIRMIREGLGRYQRRLRLAPVFDSLHSTGNHE